MPFHTCVQPAAPAATPWRPIADAPKDGTRILFYDPMSSGLIHAGIWDAKFASELDDDGETHYTGAWTDHAVASFAYEEYAEYNPTHFQPLPPPPNAP